MMLFINILLSCLRTFLFKNSCHKYMEVWSCGESNIYGFGLFIVVGDFSHTNLKIVSKSHQNVGFATRGENALDCDYTNIAVVYHAKSPLPVRLLIRQSSSFNDYLVASKTLGLDSAHGRASRPSPNTRPLQHCDGKASFPPRCTESLFRMVWSTK